MRNSIQQIHIHRTPQLKVGVSSVGELSTILTDSVAKNILIITSPELAKFGQLDTVQREINRSGSFRIHLFDQVTPDPDDALIEQIVRFGRQKKVDFVVALGGGSPMDAAKAAAALVPSAQTIHEVCGIDRVETALPLLAIPTTAGTGSEVTPIAVLTDVEARSKKAIVSEKIIPQWVILDAELTRKLPPQQTAYTGLDALSHAVEAFLSKNANAMTDFYAETAIRYLLGSIRQAYQSGDDLDARQAMQLGAYYGGLAFGNAGVTAAHAFAYPLGARYHLPHGLAVILMLPAVLEYNESAVQQKVERLRGWMATPQTHEGLSLAGLIASLCKDLDVPMGLSRFGVELSHLDVMAESVLGLGRILNNNPKPIATFQESLGIYQRAYSYC